MKTIYFIGVSTQKSAINKIFPVWMNIWGLEGTSICGVDLPLHSPADAYHEVVKRIKTDENAAGALITSHKVDLYKASRDMFDCEDRYSTLLGEVSCISKRNGALHVFAMDPVTSGMGLNAFIPENHFLSTGAEVLVLGAGGSAFSIVAYLLSGVRKDALPSKIIMANRSAGRLDEARRVFNRYLEKDNLLFEYIPTPADADRILDKVKPFSLIINATGLGKDVPGSPLTDNAVFPESSYAWDFNYRGDLHFLKQAHKQRDKHIHIEDGWTYFVHNWLQCLKEAFNVEISSEIYGTCFKLAAEYK